VNIAHESSDNSVGVLLYRAQHRLVMVEEASFANRYAGDRHSEGLVNSYLLSPVVKRTIHVLNQVVVFEAPSVSEGGVVFLSYVYMDID